MCVYRCIDQFRCRRVHNSRKQHFLSSWLLSCHPHSSDNPPKSATAASTESSKAPASIKQALQSLLDRLMKRESELLLIRPFKRVFSMMAQESAMVDCIEASHGIKSMMISYRDSRPTAIETSLVWDEERSFMNEEPLVPPAPRHAAIESTNGSLFFPSPRSVMERRSSTGSFF